MTPQIVLWIYIGLLVAGGMVGLIKGGSKISLIMSVVCAVPLILCDLNVIPFRYATWILIALFVMFGWRFAQSKKFMPMGLLCALTLATLAALQFIH
jgi:uncharacterized membrane protein (UPF0136 family)